MNILTNQYEMIKRTRESLFQMCETMSPAAYSQTIDGLGGESIRNLHVHVSDCYRVWLGVRGLGQSIPKLKPESIRDVQEMRALFEKTDLLVDEFLHHFKDNWDADIQASWMSETAELSELWLFTHCTTHEFHHRGQITKIARMLGTIPSKMNLSKIK
ncbi:DinB family protein [Paenibacillus cucumis (ex Kampfer et al. 2016)]|uniref:DinB family protein n=1 Tax=Paenibacillus cucumis (ex Kampfer et al. 2016) TaxID=1776858 RepID=A0ABS7KHY4_9BACL|nr:MULTISPECIES: DinB family protein [Paenibacillus]MBY0203706.1 DinB family protein [Paenibacillus cucumis (ex Kampfer et al. 2016)]